MDESRERALVDIMSQLSFFRKRLSETNVHGKGKRLTRRECIELVTDVEFLAQELRREKECHEETMRQVTEFMANERLKREEEEGPRLDNWRYVGGQNAE